MNVHQTIDPLTQQSYLNSNNTYFECKRGQNSMFEYSIDGLGVELTVYKGFNELEINVPAYIEDKPVYKIGDGLFKNCGHIKEIKLPSTIKSIGVSAFENTAIRTLSLPTSLESIGSLSLYGTNIERLIIPANVEVIPKYLFGNEHKKIIHIEIQGAKEICDFAFCNAKIKTRILPETLEKIGACSFRYTSIEKLIIPSNVKFMGHGSIPDNSKIAFLSDTVQINWKPNPFNNRNDPKATFYCNPGSTAQIFARKFGLPCFPLNEFYKA